jgi:hypothetical protein
VEILNILIIKFLSICKINNIQICKNNQPKTQYTQESNTEKLNFGIKDIMKQEVISIGMPNSHSFNTPLKINMV